jgi:hypothetical protein
MEEDRARLLVGLREQAPAIAKEMVERSRAEIPSFEIVPLADQLAETEAFTIWLMTFALGEEAPEIDAERLRELGRRRAEDGVPIEDLMRAWRVSVDVGTARARVLAGEMGIEPEVVIELFQRALRAADEALVPLAGGHRAGRPLTDVDPARGRELFVLALLTGEIAREDVRARAGAYGLDPQASYRALRAIGPGSPEEAPALPARRIPDSDTPDPLCTPHEGELVGIAGGLLRPGNATLVALGPPRTLEELPSSFVTAGRVLNACRAVGLEGVYDLAGAALFVAAYESGDAGDALVDRYLGSLDGVANGPELVATLRAWQEMGMRTEATAERLHIHANTLRYRLVRYEELTGVDLAETEERVGLWLALARAHLGSSRR